MEHVEDIKNARFEARIAEPVLELLRQAATLQGRSLSDFVVSSAREAAEEAIARQEVIQLSLADQQRFAAGLTKPKAVAKPLKEAAKRHRNLVEPS